MTVARWGRGLGGWMKKVKGLKSTDWELQNGHGDVKYNIESTVNNILIITKCQTGPRFIGMII